MDRLFTRLDGMYPIRWRSAFNSDKAIESWKHAWSEAFAEEGLTADEVKAGIAACRRMYDWPPSLTEFMKACRPGLQPEVAFHEAVAGMSARRSGDIGAWSHPAVYWAAVAVGAHDLLNCGYSVMKARWERALGEEIAKGTWQTIPAPAPALPAPGNTLTDRKEAAKRMAEMKATGALDQSGLKPTRWMKKIQDRIEKGASVSPAIVAMLQRAFEDGKRP